MRSKRIAWAFAFVGCFSGLIASHVCAQSGPDALPKIVNGHVETRALSGTLSQELNNLREKTLEPFWAAYAVPGVAGERILCCGNYDMADEEVGGHCGNCRLEGRKDGTNITSSDSGSARPDERRRIVALYRIEHKQVGKIRVVSEDCTLDAGGRTLIWLTGVKPADSVAWLATFVRNDPGGQHERRSLGDEALTALAMHGDAAADRALESFAAPDHSAELRKQASFWLGSTRGKTGLTALEKMARNDPSPDVRGQVAFAFSVSHEPGAVDDLIRMAHGDESAHAREQALFWLAQKAGQKAIGAITGAIANDPNEEVKKKAVFALSQLPKDEGVPKLIEVAQTNRNAEVRKQAMFWLGQSEDPRALAFFEKVLTQ